MVDVATELEIFCDTGPRAIAIGGSVNLEEGVVVGCGATICCKGQVVVFVSELWASDEIWEGDI